MKARRWIMGVQVRGTLEQLESTMRRYAADEVVLSSPSINGDVEDRIRETCARLERPVRRPAHGHQIGRRARVKGQR